MQITENSLIARPSINPQIEPTWKAELSEEFAQPYFAKIKQMLLEEKNQGATVYPPGKFIFNAFNFTPFDQVKVVILGQDPYHNEGQAHGLCFSVQTGVKPPPSLANIYKEIQNDLGIKIPNHGNLESWAKQGILLLNSSLTVRAHEAGSHAKFGWQIFTDAVVRKLSERKKGLVFLLWGSPAQKKGAVIDTNHHHILKAPHPSPLSAHGGFFGCKHFSKTNELLKNMGQKPIDWQL